MVFFEKTQITQQLNFSCTNQDQIRNQQPRLRRNTLYLGRKAGFFTSTVRFVIFNFYKFQNTIS